MRLSRAACSGSSRAIPITVADGVATLGSTMWLLRDRRAHARQSAERRMKRPTGALVARAAQRSLATRGRDAGSTAMYRFFRRFERLAFGIVAASAIVCVGECRLPVRTRLRGREPDGLVRTAAGRTDGAK